MLILLIDDDDSVRSCLEMALLQLGYDCVPSAGGEEVFQLIQAHQFDLILTDVDMPVLSGTEIVARCTIHHPDIPIIVMSGKSMPATLSPDIPFLAKPFALTRLIDTIDKQNQVHEEIGGGG